MEEKISKLGSTLGLSECNSTWWGTVMGLPCLIRQDEGGFSLSMRFSLVPNEAIAQLIGFMERQKTAGTVKNYTLSPQGQALEATINEDAGEAMPLFFRELASLTELYGIQGACMVCNASSGLSFYTLDENPASICPSCAAAFNKEEKRRKDPSAYIGGAFGAILGALVGSIVWIVVGALGFYVSLAGLAIGAAALYAYQFFNGPQSPARLPIIGIAILFALAVAEYVGIGIQVFKESSQSGWGLDLAGSFALIPAILADQEAVLGILPNLGLGLVFAGLGTFSLLKNLAAPSPVVIARPLKGE